MILHWTPRILGVLLTLFLAAFALDAFSEGPMAVVIHLLPAALVGLVIAAAWRKPILGAVAFAALAVGYALMVPSRPDWILAISGPLGLTALLFAVSAARRTALRPVDPSRRRADRG
jgi:hypothetical protein